MEGMDDDGSGFKAGSSELPSSSSEISHSDYKKKKACEVCGSNADEVCGSNADDDEITMLGSQKRSCGGKSLPARVRQFTERVSDPSKSISMEFIQEALGPIIPNILESNNENPISGSIYCYRSNKRDNSATRGFHLRWTSSSRDGNSCEHLLKSKEATHELLTAARVMAGPVRDQKLHPTCWAHASVDLVSAVRIHKGLAVEYQLLSVPELVYYASPDLRFTLYGHGCYEHYIEAALDYIQQHGIGIHQDNLGEFNCLVDLPNSEGEKIRIQDVIFIGTDLQKAIHQLAHHPIGACIAVFDPEYFQIGDGIYRGPTSHSSELAYFHSVVVLAAWIQDGEVIVEIKDSRGTKDHNGGYFKASASIMLLSFQFDDNSEVAIGINKKTTKSPLQFKKPEPLLQDFVYPVV